MFLSPLSPLSPFPCIYFSDFVLGLEAFDTNLEVCPAVILSIQSPQCPLTEFAQAVGAKPVTFHRQVSSASLAPMRLKCLECLVYRLDQ